MSNNNSTLSTNLDFTPIIDVNWLWTIAICGIILLAFSAFYYRRGILIRSFSFIVFLLALLNPSLLSEERDYVNDVAVIIVDQSTSQKMERREQRTNTALTSLQEQIENMDMFELRVLHAPIDQTLTSRTDLFDALDQNLTDVPQKRRAGVIFLTDGQVHDIPKNENSFNDYGPVHVLLSGHKNEKDRQIVITNAPAYGLVGKNVTILSQRRIKHN